MDLEMNRGVIIAQSNEGLSHFMLDIKGQKSDIILRGFARSDILQEAAEIFKRIPVIGNSTSNETIEQSAGMGATGSSSEQPVFAPERKGSDLIFSAVICSSSNLI